MYVDTYQFMYSLLLYGTHRRILVTHGKMSVRFFFGKHISTEIRTYIDTYVDIYSELFMFHNRGKARRSINIILNRLSHNFQPLCTLHNIIITPEQSLFLIQQKSP